MDKVKIWWEASRAFSFTASIVPVLLGSILAWADGHFSWWLFSVTLFGSILIQAGTNFTNDFYDYLSGVDRLEEDGVHLAGPSMVIQRGLLEPNSVRNAGLLCFILGAACGLYLVAQCGWLLLLPGLLSVAAGYYYTARPVALAYLALGEVTVFVFMGPVMVLGAYYVQTSTLSALPLLLSLPIACLVTAILHANNLRDLSRDRERGKTTLATLGGEKLAALELALLVFGAYALVAWLVGSGQLTGMSAVVFLTMPEAVRIVKTGFAGPGSSESNENVLRTAQLHGSFGAFLLAALWVSTLISSVLSWSI